MSVRRLIFKGMYSAVIGLFWVIGGHLILLLGQCLSYRVLGNSLPEGLDATLHFQKWQELVTLSATVYEETLWIMAIAMGAYILFGARKAHLYFRELFAQLKQGVGVDSDEWHQAVSWPFKQRSSVHIMTVKYRYGWRSWREKPFFKIPRLFFRKIKEAAFPSCDINKL
jgi:hypothetical protein